MKNKLHKNLILAKQNLKQELNKKSGTYQLVNLVNGKTYVGSSVNLHLRLVQYTNINKNSLKKSKSKIHQAIVKYGHENFGIRILEIIDLDFIKSTKERRDLLIQNEQFFIDSLNPEYNILRIAGSPLGSKNTAITKYKKSLAQLNRDSNRRGKEVTYDFLSKYVETHGRASPINMCNDKDEILARFPSITIASEITGIQRMRISRCVTGLYKEIEHNGKIYRFHYDLSPAN